MTDDTTTVTGATEASTHVQLTIRPTDGDDAVFRVRLTTKLEKVMTTYCTRVGQPLQSVRFFFDGERLKGDRTADDYGLQDGDVIDALHEQTG